MTILNVPNMHCGKCVERIQNALGEMGANFEISLDNKTVTVTSGDIDAIVETLDDLGFEAKK